MLVTERFQGAPSILLARFRQVGGAASKWGHRHAKLLGAKLGLGGFRGAHTVGFRT